MLVVAGCRRALPPPPAATRLTALRLLRPRLPCAVGFACGTLPDVILSLQLPAGRLAALFLPRLGPLPLAVPGAAELRLCCYSPGDAAHSYYAPSDPYL